MSYTLGEAAKATGKSKPTIQRAIKSGKISAIKNENGSYTIEPAELHRVFSVKHQDSNETGDMKQSVTLNELSMLQTEVNVLMREIEVLKKERERERDLLNQQVEIYKERLDRADKDKDQLTALLTDTRKQGAGFWKRLLGR